MHINRPWAQSLLAADFEQVKKQFLKDVTETVLMEEIPPELVLNWDQSGINIVPASLWTMNQQGKKGLKCLVSKTNVKLPLCSVPLFREIFFLFN